MWSHDLLAACLSSGSVGRALTRASHHLLSINTGTTLPPFIFSSPPLYVFPPFRVPLTLQKDSVFASVCMCVCVCFDFFCASTCMSHSSVVSRPASVVSNGLSSQSRGPLGPVSTSQSLKILVLLLTMLWLSGWQREKVVTELK